MGSQYCEMIVKSSDKQVVLEKFNTEQASNAYEYGHGGYTGTFAEAEDDLHWHLDSFNSIEDARDWVVENHRKWDKAMCVPVEVKDDRFFYIGGWMSS